MADDDFSDPDVNLLVALAGALRENYSDDDSSWEGSPFAWIRRRPPRSIGAISENIVAEFFAARGFDVTRSSDTDSDRIINGLRTAPAPGLLKPPAPSTPSGSRMTDDASSSPDSVLSPTTTAIESYSPNFDAIDQDLRRHFG